MYGPLEWNYILHFDYIVISKNRAKKQAKKLNTKPNQKGLANYTWTKFIPRKTTNPKPQILLLGHSVHQAA